MDKLARIVSVGSYLPEKILSNEDLEKMVDTSDEWICSRTGIRQRRIAAANEYPSHMGAFAARQALERASMSALEVELIILATMTPDYTSSSTAAIVQHAIGATHAAAFDIQAACSGYLYALSVAKAFVESGLYQNVLVVTAEKMSAIVDYTDRTTCILFGDGASAAVVSNKGAGLRLAHMCLGANGGPAEMLVVPAGGSCLPASLETVQACQHFIKMQGKELFRQAVPLMAMAAQACLQKAALQESDISWFVPHQANERIIDAVAKKFNAASGKVFKNLDKYGNTSASSIGIALDELLQKQKLAVGENVLLFGFGAGLTWGAFLLTQIEGS